VNVNDGMEVTLAVLSSEAVEQAAPFSVQYSERRQVTCCYAVIAREGWLRSWLLGLDRDQ